MEKARNKILKALFDIKPVDETGSVDIGKIASICGELNLKNPADRRRNIQSLKDSNNDKETLKVETAGGFKHSAKRSILTANSVLASLEKHLNTALNIKKEIKNIGGKTVSAKNTGKPRLRPILVGSKYQVARSGSVEPSRTSGKGLNRDFDNDYETILKQINEKGVLPVDGVLTEEPEQNSPVFFEALAETRPVAASSEIESWVRYARDPLPATDKQPVLGSIISKLKNRKILLVASFIAVLSVSMGKYGVGIKNQILKEGNSAVANLEQADENLKAFDFAAASNNFAAAYNEFSKAGETLNFMGASITSLFAELPGAGKLKSAKNLVEAGKLLAEAGKSMSEAVGSLSKTGAIFNVAGKKQDDNREIENLKKSLAASGRNLSNVRALLSDVSLEALPDDKKESFLEFQSKLPKFEELVSDAAGYTNFLERLAGANGAKKYLVLFQNNSELRPTGGFPGTYAVLAFENGQLKEFKVDDVYNLDGQLKENIVPPFPLQHITPTWGMRDANWFIDFSVSAQKAMEFFKKEAGYGVDGVITASPQMVSDILKIVGPIEMPEYDSIIDSNNFVSTIQEEIEYGPNRQQPKKIVMDMAPKLFEKINSAEPAQWLDIFNVFMAGLGRKDILMYFSDLNLENFAAEKGFGGLVKNSSDGYLMVTISNVKGSKTDRVTDNYIKAAVRFEGGRAVYNLELTRKHNGGDTEYGFYNRQNPAFVRVLIPENAELIDVSGNSKPSFKPLIKYSGDDFKRDSDLSKLESTFNFDEGKGVWIYRESGKSGVAFWMITDAGGEKTVELEYSVPLENGGGDYSIYIQKQPGIEIDDFEFKAGGGYIYKGKLDNDLELRFKLQ